MPSILVVEQEPHYVERISAALGAEGWRVRVVPTVEQALQAAAGERPDLIVAGTDAPGFDVLTFSFSRRAGGPGVLALETGGGSADGADGRLAKPFTDQQIVLAARKALLAHQQPAAAAPAPDQKLTSHDIFGDVLAEVEGDAPPRPVIAPPRAVPPPPPHRRPRRPPGRRPPRRRGGRPAPPREDPLRHARARAQAAAGRAAPERGAGGRAAAPPPRRAESSSDNVDALLSRTLSNLDLGRTKTGRAPHRRPPGGSGRCRSSAAAPPAAPPGNPGRDGRAQGAGGGGFRFRRARGAGPPHPARRHLPGDGARAPRRRSGAPVRRRQPRRRPAAPVPAAAPAPRRLPRRPAPSRRPRRRRLPSGPRWPWTPPSPSGSRSSPTRGAISRASASASTCCSRGSPPAAWPRSGRRACAASRASRRSSRSRRSCRTCRTTRTSSRCSSTRRSWRRSSTTPTSSTSTTSARSARDYYIAMEYIDGHDLRSHPQRRARKRDQPMPRRARRCSSRLEDRRGPRLRAPQAGLRRPGAGPRPPRRLAAERAHLASEGDIKLCDFGIAKAASKASHTQAGALKGKLQYMSPEQAWGQPDRPPLRHLRARRGAVRDAHRRAPVHRRQRDLDPRAGARGARRRRRAGGSRRVPPEIDEIVPQALQGSRRPLSDRRRDGAAISTRCSTASARRRPAPTSPSTCIGSGSRSRDDAAERAQPRRRRAGAFPWPAEPPAAAPAVGAAVPAARGPRRREMPARPVRRPRRARSGRGRGGGARAAPCSTPPSRR